VEEVASGEQVACFRVLILHFRTEETRQGIESRAPVAEHAVLVNQEFLLGERSFAVDAQRETQYLWEFLVDLGEDAFAFSY